MLIVTKYAEDPQYVFEQFIDRQYDQSEMQTLFTYGVQGYHWDEIDGATQFLINENDPYKVHFTKSFVPPVDVINQWDQPMVIDEVITPALNILNENSRQEKIKFGKSNYDRYYLEIERVLKPEIISKIINGELTIDEGMALYEKRATELSLDKVLAELNGQL